MKQSGVYCIKNIQNNKRYIGSSMNIYKRFSEHLERLRKKNHVSKHLQFAFDKYGESNFKFNIILICSLNDLLFYEQQALDYYKSYNRARGYNTYLTAGSPIGFKHSEETKKNLSEIFKTICNTPEGKENNRLKFLGKQHSEKTKRELSVKRKQYSSSEQGKKQLSSSTTRNWQEGKMSTVSPKMKSLWQNKEYREETISKMKNYYQSLTEEKSKKLSNRTRQNWANPLIRERMLGGIRNRQNNKCGVVYV